MAQFCEFGAGSDSGTVTVTVTTDQAVPIGSTLVLALASGTSTTALSGITVSDAGGNTWSTAVGPLAVTGSITSLTMAVCKVTSAIGSGTDIVITGAVPSGSINCLAASIVGFDTDQDVGPFASYDNGGANTTTWTPGPTASSDGSVVVCAIAMVNPGRTVTAGSGFTLGTKVLGTAASGNRAVCMEWRTDAPSGTHSAEIGYTSSGSGVAVVLSLPDHGIVPSRSGLVKIWNGTAWEQHPMKVWDGSQWVDAKLKVWDGTDWVLTK